MFQGHRPTFLPTLLLGPSRQHKEGSGESRVYQDAQKILISGGLRHSSSGTHGMVPQQGLSQGPSKGDHKRHQIRGQSQTLGTQGHQNA